jgi:hypothetical protein
MLGVAYRKYLRWFMFEIILSFYLICAIRWQSPNKQWNWVDLKATNNYYVLQVTTYIISGTKFLLNQVVKKFPIFYGARRFINLSRESPTEHILRHKCILLICLAHFIVSSYFPYHPFRIPDKILHESPPCIPYANQSNLQFWMLLNLVYA